MEYLNRFKSSIHSVAAQVTDNVIQALPGNPIFREYECHEVVASAGPGHAWKIFRGTKNSSKQAVSIWLFDKKYCDKWPRQDKEAFPELLKRGISQLTRLRHPRLLIVEHSLEESRDTFAFCTEPVFASLSNIFGDDNNSQGNFKNEDLKLEDIEIRHGLFQLGEALAFLHNDAKLLHGNICPSSIIISEKGAWKLAGFDFCILGTPNANGQITFQVEERNRRSMAIMNPCLNYSAPELVQGVKADNYADIFSVGMLSFALFNDYRPLFDNKDLLDAFKTNLDKLKALSVNQLSKIPAELREDVKACLNYTPELRPDAIQFTKIVYFDDTLVKTLNYLDSLMQMDNTQKMQFFKGLPQVLTKFAKRPLLQKVLPYLTAEFNTPQLIPFILPSIFIIAENATNEEFSKTVFPPLIPVFSMTNPYQIVLILLQKMSLFLQKTPEADIKRYVLPLVYGAIMNDNIKIQELCLSIIPSIGKLVERDAMKTQLLPKLLKLALEGTVISIRIQTLVCIGKLMPTLEPWMVSDQIIPALPKINSKEPGILMAILGIYKLANENEKFGIGREQAAKSVLPFLISTTVENTLNLSQFEQYVSMIRLLFDRLEKEQRNRLQQLSAGQEEQRNFQDFTEMINAESTKVNSAPDLDALSALFGPTGIDRSANSTPKPGGQLTLEEKKRLAAEQENSIRTKDSSQSPLPIQKNKPMNSYMNNSNSNNSSNNYSGTVKNNSSLNNLFDSSFSSTTSMTPKNGTKPSTNDSFAFNDFVVSSPSIPPSSTGASASRPMNSFSTGSFALPPPPSAPNPVQRSNFTGSSFTGFGIPPPPGSSSSSAFGFSSTASASTSASKSTNDDILDLFKQTPQPKQQPSTNIDELLRLANAIPAPPQSSSSRPHSKDPFADLLK